MSAPHRIVLLPQGRPTVTDRSAGKVRRYRLARVRVAETREPREPRFSHLARAYD